MSVCLFVGLCEGGASVES